MTRWALVALLTLSLGLGAMAWRYERQARLLATENAALHAAFDRQSAVTRTMEAAFQRERSLRLAETSLIAELDHVLDDNSCRSPAIDAALGIVRARRDDPAP
ncbi:MAG: hypothetical protein AAFR47_17460 [Pseudomonadota bacterium]